TGSRLAALEAELNARDEALKEREETVAGREAALAENEKTLAESTEKVNAHEAELAKKESELKARESELEAGNKKLAEATDSLAKRDSALISRELEAAQKSTELQELEALIKELPAFNPNNSTEAAMILTYKIPAEKRRQLIAMQREAYTRYSSNRVTQALESYTAAFEAEPTANYLAAYWAALSAERLRNRRDDALMWVNRALEINPDYRPAQELKRRLEGSSRNSQQRRRTTSR
ncbi:MAG: hypothetical protein IJR11_06440, partial [Synergistaceae bacterium]|nr:hypothetical protein [Synergistaceae bacterium]